MSAFVCFELASGDPIWIRADEIITVARFTTIDTDGSTEHGLLGIRGYHQAIVLKDYTSALEVMGLRATPPDEVPPHPRHGG